MKGILFCFAYFTKDYIKITPKKISLNPRISAYKNNGFFGGENFNMILLEVN